MVSLQLGIPWHTQTPEASCKSFSSMTIFFLSLYSCPTVLKFFSVSHSVLCIVYGLETDQRLMLERHITEFKCGTAQGQSLVLQICFREKVSRVPASVFLKHSM